MSVPAPASIEDPLGAAPAGESGSLDVVNDRRRLTSLLSPLRRELLEALAEEPASATGLSQRLSLPRQKINYHLRALESSGFVELELERKRRGCTERILRPIARSLCIDPAVLGRLAVDPSAVQDRFSSAYLLALATRMASDVGSLRRGAAAARKSLPTLSMDTEVSFASPETRAAFAKELAASLAALTAKYHDEGDGSRAFRFVLGGHPVLKPDEATSTSPAGERS